MNKNQKIIVTGGAGFIGSNVVQGLNNAGLTDIIIVDHLATNKEKEKNLTGLNYSQYLDKDELLDLLKSDTIKDLDVIIHLGARTDTTEQNKDFIIKYNTEYSKEVYNYCLKNNCRLIYASSAATYGDGSKGYDDDKRDLEPLNFYGLSKYLFDEWILNNPQKISQWVGLKFFNVYGPNEYHKGRMASVVFHGFNQIMNEGQIKLFRSHKEGYQDGEQKRDFVYVKDIVKVILFFLVNSDKSGIFNLGTGSARTFYDLAKATFKAMNLDSDITFIDMPEDLRGKYQYFTQAKMDKLRKVGYTEKFYELEEGVEDYVKNYLIPKFPKIK